MVQNTGKIRFLLCEPSERKKLQANNIFCFEGKFYVVHSFHRDLEEAKEFSTLFTVHFLIAKVSFAQDEKPDNTKPYEFLNWEKTSQKNLNSPQL